MCFTSQTVAGRTACENWDSTEASRGVFRRFFVFMLIAVSLCLHIYVVYTIMRQPLDVNRYLGTPRSAIWALHHDTIHRIGPGADLFAIYHAGRALRHGKSPYEKDEGEELSTYFYSFRYLPIVGQTIGRSLIQLSPRTAYVLWICILEGFLSMLIFILRRRTKSRRLRCFSTCVLLLSSPYFLELHMGQFTFIAVSMLSIGMLIQEYPKGKAGLWASILCAMSFASATLLKIFPSVVSPAFIRHRRYWLSLALAVVVILGTAVPYFVLHPYDWVLFYRTNISSTTGGMHAGNYGLMYLIHLVAGQLRLTWFSDHWIGFLSFWRVVALSITGFIVLFSRCRRVIIGSAIMIFAHFLSYAHVWEHHMSGAIAIGLPLLLVVNDKASRSRRKTIMALLVISLLLLALPTPFALFDRDKDPLAWDPAVDWAPYVKGLLALSKVVPTMILYLICATMLVKAGFALPWRGRRVPGEKYNSASGIIRE